MDMQPQTRQTMILCFVLFFLFLGTHMQSPFFAPFAVSLGASSFLVGTILSVTSFANMTGNLLAGPVIDKVGKRPFIIFPLVCIAIVFLLHMVVTDVKHLFVLRMINGFLLAFLTPACMALLSGLAQTSRERSRNMALNGLIITVATIVAPLIGGRVAEDAGFPVAYLIIGTLVFASFLFALRLAKWEDIVTVKKHESTEKKQSVSMLLPISVTAFAMMYAQGTLMYELPFLAVDDKAGKGDVGQFISLIGLGTLGVLLFPLIHRIPAIVRAFLGLLSFAVSFYWILLVGPIPTPGALLVFGIGFGLLFPSVTTLVGERLDRGAYGKGFAFLSAVFSLGSISSPFIAGVVRDFMSPYFIAFLLVAVAFTIMGMEMIRMIRGTTMG
ncbi:MFS transporter [Texcoconibacillus texcoconensis]|uniref:MFS family permease n=1 Tax=Texcoconibacillus texcoconensis TaxID=1095777 RepID=A0A840QPH9_9BACI|nr:MFS transporter [Texcoconibacillus texcoconensis]MBB5173233.1 MFS family permease [Texcoconibacillus texcoconensis]